MVLILVLICLAGKRDKQHHTAKAQKGALHTARMPETRAANEPTPMWEHVNVSSCILQKLRLVVSMFSVGAWSLTVAVVTCARKFQTVIPQQSSLPLLVFKAGVYKRLGMPCAGLGLRFLSCCEPRARRSRGGSSNSLHPLTLLKPHEAHLHLSVRPSPQGAPGSQAQTSAALGERVGADSKASLQNAPFGASSSVPGCTWSCLAWHEGWQALFVQGLGFWVVS